MSSGSYTSRGYRNRKRHIRLNHESNSQEQRAKREGKRPTVPDEKQFVGYGFQLQDQNKAVEQVKIREPDYSPLADGRENRGELKVADIMRASDQDYGRLNGYSLREMKYPPPKTRLLEQEEHMKYESLRDRDFILKKRNYKVASELEHESIGNNYDGWRHKGPHQIDEINLRKNVRFLQDQDRFNGGIREGMKGVLKAEHGRWRYHQGNPRDVYLRKTDWEYGFPRCSEEELRYWIRGFDKHCLENHIAEHEKLREVYQSLQGPTNNWIKELWEQHPPSSWDEFKRLILQEQGVDDERMEYQTLRAGKCAGKRSYILWMPEIAQLDL
ncbi:hypothetical protein AALP_AA6G242900 [Arabis alpina]|uniref:Retrotransposon gag domain-containing protein n=1 Tax=Arabis alpina TaxID=50452 RepID=A0A087GRE4_ARAAL|nr:hypothetical protein AALP_AA6G242900 [Arabis alpina]